MPLESTRLGFFRYKRCCFNLFVPCNAADVKMRDYFESWPGPKVSPPNRATTSANPRPYSHTCVADLLYL